MKLPRLCGGIAALALVLGVGAAPADALVSPTQPIDGPSAAIRELGGVAMSQDGTGGLVYRKDVDGRPHIFAAQFVNGAWLPAQRVDNGPTQQFESSWPAIAAGDGGRLIVIWVQEFGPADRMYSSTLQPGSRRFEAPVPIDLNVGDSSLGTYPSVSMAAGGQAYLVYRVVTDAAPASAPPGSVLGEYRIARYTGQLWSGFGTPVNRNLASAQPTPTALDRPRIGADQLGSAVVAWQELDDQLVPRIYARRVFPSSVGIARQVSPADLSGTPLRAGADAFGLAVGRYGEAAVAWRQQPSPPGSGGGFTRPRMFVSQSPDAFSPDAATFAAPRAFDGAGADGPSDALGATSVAVSGSSVLTAFTSGATALAVDATDSAVDAPQRLDAGGGAGAPDPVAALGDSGAAAFAWKSNVGNRGSVVARERRSDAVTTDRVLSAPRGGVVDSIDLQGSGLGDALIGFSQGTGAGRQIAAAAVDAPADVFNVQTPLGFVRSATIPLQWDPAAHAIGGVTYSVVVDDDTVFEGLTGTSAKLKSADIADGVRTVTVIATDDAGQETASVPAQLSLDSRPPAVSVRHRGRAVSVRVSDGKKGQVSGVATNAISVSFGDGAHAARHTRSAHRYARTGRFRVTVRVKDKIGNARTVRRIVRIP